MKHNIEQIEHFCYNVTLIWLHIHYFYVFGILIYIALMTLLLYPFMVKMWLLCRRYFFSYDQVDEQEEFNTEETFNSCLIYNFIGIFMTEVILAFIYIIATLILTYTLNITPITERRINRWINEGFYAPLLIFLIWYLYYVYYTGQHIYIFIILYVMLSLQS